MRRDPYIALGFAILMVGVLLVAGFMATMMLCIVGA